MYLYSLFVFCLSDRLVNIKKQQTLNYCDILLTKIPNKISIYTYIDEDVDVDVGR